MKAVQVVKKMRQAQKDFERLIEVRMEADALKGKMKRGLFAAGWWFYLTSFEGEPAVLGRHNEKWKNELCFRIERFGESPKLVVEVNDLYSAKEVNQARAAIYKWLNNYPEQATKVSFREWIQPALLQETQYTVEQVMKLGQTFVSGDFGIWLRVYEGVPRFDIQKIGVFQGDAKFVVVDEKVLELERGKGLDVIDARKVKTFLTECISQDFAEWEPLVWG